MTPIDDLKIGMWIAIFSVREEDAGGESSWFGMSRQKTRGYPINGKPLQIKAISLPFICVSDGRARYSIDCRQCDVKKLNTKYVTAMTSERRDRNESYDTYAIRETEPKTIGRKRKKEDKRGCCPQCGTRLIQRLTQPGVWFWACTECGFEGGNTSQ